jgi:pimeloyl-ACP methyl ester carboxylesterase
VILLYIALTIIAYLPYKTTPVQKLAGKDGKFIKVNGNNIHYIKKGNGKPLILVHGFAGSTYTWKNLIPLLTEDYTVYALDLLGFGLSDKPPDGSYDLPSQGDLVLSFIDAVGIPSATLIGHSMGGIIISYAAIKDPSRVDKLVIIEAGFYHGGAPAFLQYLFFPLEKIMAKLFYTKGFRSKSLLPSYYNKSIVTNEVIEANLIAGRTPNSVEAMAKMMADAGPQTYEGLGTRITQPTLLVWSQYNKNNPVTDGKRLKNEIAGSQLTIIDNCGHYVQEEKPAELASAIKDFLSQQPVVNSNLKLEIRELTK